MEFVIGAVAQLLIVFVLYKYYTWSKQRKGEEPPEQTIVQEEEAAPVTTFDSEESEDGGKVRFETKPIDSDVADRVKEADRENRKYISKKFELRPSTTEKKRVRARKFGDQTYYYENGRWNQYEPYVAPFLVPVFLSSETVDEEPDPDTVGGSDIGRYPEEKGN